MVIQGMSAGELLDAAQILLNFAIRTATAQTTAQTPKGEHVRDAWGREVVTRANDRMELLRAHGPSVATAFGEGFIKIIEAYPLLSMCEGLTGDVIDLELDAVLRPLDLGEQRVVCKCLRAMFEDISAYTTHHDQDDSRNRPLIRALGYSFSEDGPRIEKALSNLFRGGGDGR